MNFRCSLAMALLCSSPALAAELRIGIIGCDTSHVPAFTELLNNPEGKDHVAGGRVIGAVKGGSPDIPSSASRLEGYTKTLQEKYGVKIYPTVEELCQNVDAVLIESLDGRTHLEQARPVIKAGKPVFIDKPMADSLQHVLEIFRLAKAAKVPVFSSSSLRFGKGTQAIHKGSIGKVNYVEAFGPCELEPHHPDLFWYGVHGVEVLFTILGPNCESVQRSSTPEGKIIVTGKWSGDRKGIFTESKDFRGLAKGDEGEAPAGSNDGYAPLVTEIMKFFKTGVAPVSPEETIGIFAFMEAADESKRSSGGSVSIKELLRERGE